MTPETIPIASLEEVPLMNYYHFGVEKTDKECGAEAIIETDPTQGTVSAIWDIVVGETRVPMVTVAVGTTRVHVDQRSPLGQQIMERHRKSKM